MTSKELDFMGTIFLTGVTGYIGSYVAHGLLEKTGDRLAVLVRAENEEVAKQRLWKSLQLHMDFDTFARYLPRFDIYLGDLTETNLGLSDEAWSRLARSMDSVLHVAASLNRKSAKACFNVNLRGTLSVVRLARAAADDHGLRRFSDVSTVAVAGERRHETVTEEGCIDWNRSDYDPYARTKKFCEHMIHELLPDVPTTVFRPATVLGDSRFPETTQFDMVTAFAALAYMRVLPFNPEWRVDIVPADYVGKAIVHIHTQDGPVLDAYHLSAGDASLTYGEIHQALRTSGHRAKFVFMPKLGTPFRAAVDALSNTPRGWGMARHAALLKVFLPYLTFDTVFDNRRVVGALGESPAPFSDYAYPLLRFAVDGGFRYPYKAWPHDAEQRILQGAAEAAG